MDCVPSEIFDERMKNYFVERKIVLNNALGKIKEVEELLTWTKPTSLTNLKGDLNSLLEYYSFLLTTQTTVVSTELGYFSVLPMEVLMLIFSHLDVKGVCRMCNVCKQFKILGEDEEIWRKLARNLDTLQIEYKPLERSWRWLCRASLHIFKENEKKNSPGTYIWPNPIQQEDGRLPIADTKYSGDWKDDKRHGYGTYYWSNGSLYSGEWVDDKREGYGTRVWPNKNRYTGQYLNHKRHGEGEFTFSNGSIFTGTFEDNKFIKGTYTWPNGRVYNGEWNNIFRHGKGSYWWPDGRTYVGVWKNDKRHGRGVYSWPDGDTFEGDFNDGRRWGPGTLKCTNGEVFEQDWQEEKFEEFNKGVESTEDGNTTVHPHICKKRKSTSEPEDDLPPKQKIKKNSQK